MNGLFNYNELWRVLHSRRRGSTVDWDKRASSFFKAISKNNEAEAVIDTLNLSETDTVMDMGAGTGRFAVPIAMRVSHLTAVEPSKGMVSFLNEGMQKAGLTNYSVVQKRWEDVEIGDDIPIHDVVFASNSLGFPDLAEGLKKLDSAARRSVHILWFAGPERHPLNPELLKRLGRDEKPPIGPDYLLIVNVLHDMGIYANVSIERTNTDHVFDDLDEAVTWWSERGDIDPNQEPIVREYLSETLVSTDEGQLLMKRQGWRARIWWEKE